MTNRNSRETETRSARERKKEWKEPRLLDLPTPPEGYQWRWVRTDLRGEDHSMNVLMRERQGYELVKPEEVGDLAPLVPESGRFAGKVQVGDLVAMKVPVEIAEQRQRFYQDRANALLADVDRELDKNQNKDMPITRERSTSVTVGRKPTFQE